MDQINISSIIENVTPIIENTCVKYGVIPIEISLKKLGKNYLLQIFIYSNNKPITLDDCEKISRNIDPFIEEIIDVNYFLEVSSPGLTRKIKSSKEYIIFKGKKILIKTKTNECFPNYTVEGEIIDFDENQGVLINVRNENKTEENLVRIKLEDIKSSQLIYEEKN